MADTTLVVSEPDRLATAYCDGPDRPLRMADDGDIIPLGENGVTIWPGRAMSSDAFPSGGAGMSGTAGDYLVLLETIPTGGAPIVSPCSARGIGRHQIGDLRAWTEGDGWGHGLGGAVLLDPVAAQRPQNAGTCQWGAHRDVGLGDFQ